MKLDWYVGYNSITLAIVKHSEIILAIISLFILIPFLFSQEYSTIYNKSLHNHYLNT